jgi:hypothetical protein
MREDDPMPDVVIGEDAVARCPWATTDPLNQRYHDEDDTTSVAERAGAAVTPGPRLWSIRGR